MENDRHAIRLDPKKNYQHCGIVGSPETMRRSRRRMMEKERVILSRKNDNRPGRANITFAALPRFQELSPAESVSVRNSPPDRKLKAGKAASFTRWNNHTYVGLI